MTKRRAAINAPHCFSAPGEEWRPLPLNPGYWASNNGRIASGPGRTTLGRVLSQHPSTHGRMRVSVSNGARPTKREVHRLVTEAFHGLPPTPLHEAAHNDGNILNNASKNLRWATHAENIADKQRHGTQLRGSMVSTARFTEAEVLEMRRRAAAGEPRPSLVGAYAISKSALDEILRGDRWAHVAVLSTPSNRVGARHPKARLDAARVRLMRQRFAEGVSDTLIAAEFAVRPGTVWAVRTGVTWNHVT